MTDTKFKPGKSGNPKGRPAGTGEIAKLRASIATHVPEIINKQVELAKAGDAQAARLLLDRVLPTIKPTDQATPVDLPDGTLTERGNAVIAALGAGEIPAAQASQVLAALASLATITKTDELAARVAELEKHHAEKR